MVNLRISVKKTIDKKIQNKVQRFPYMLHNAANEQLAQEIKLLATSLSTYNTSVRSKC